MIHLTWPLISFFRKRSAQVFVHVENVRKQQSTPCILSLNSLHQMSVSSLEETLNMM